MTKAAVYANYRSDTQSFLSGSVRGDTVTLSVSGFSDRLEEGSFPTRRSSDLTTSNADVTEDGSGTVNVTDNDSATVTLSDTADVEEGGATDTLTVTLTLQTSGSGPVALATDINGITLAGNADYSSDTQSFLSGAVAGDTVTLTVTAVNDRLVEGPESFTALLVNTTRDRKSVV